MFTEAHSAVFFVGDLEEVVAWYERLLGVSASIRRAGFARFDRGRCSLCFHDRDAKGAGPAGSQVIYWTVEDVDEAVRHFMDCGGTVYREAIVVEDGARICQIRDPFGCVHGLAQRGDGRGGVNMPGS